MNRRQLMATAVAAIAIGLTSATANAEDKLIAGVVFQQDQFFNGIELGMKAAAAKAGGIELLLGNTESRPEKEASMVDTYVTRGVKAIIISPISPKGSIPALKRAADQGIKVVAYNTFNMNWDFLAANLSSNQADLGGTTGKAAAAFIKDKLGGKAKLALLGFRSQGAEASDLRTNSFLDAAKAGGNQRPAGRLARRARRRGCPRHHHRQPGYRHDLRRQ